MIDGTCSNNTEKELSVDEIYKGIKEATEKLGELPKPKDIGVVSLLKDCRNVLITNGFADHIVINKNNFKLIKEFLDSINQPKEKNHAN